MHTLLKTICRKIRITSTDYNKLLPVEQHLRLVNPDFSKEAEFTIIEKIEKIVSVEITSILESHEDN